MTQQASRSIRWSLSLVLALVVALVGCGSGQPQGAPQEDGAATSAPATQTLSDCDGELVTGRGEAVALSDVAQGRPLVINFWTTWCPYCVEELPDFQEIVAEYGDRADFAFVDVTGAEEGTAEDVAAWLEEYGFDDLPVYYDEAMEVTRNFEVVAYPTTVVVSADGEVLSNQAGRIDPILLRGQLEQLV